MTIPETKEPDHDVVEHEDPHNIEPETREPTTEDQDKHIESDGYVEEMETQGTDNRQDCDPQEDQNSHTEQNVVQTSTMFDRNAAMYILKLKEVHHISKSAIDCVVSTTRSLLEQQSAVLREAVTSEFQDSEQVHVEISRAFESTTDSFRLLDTGYKQEKYFREHFHLIVSSEH